MKKLKGNIQIGMITGGTTPDEVDIVITDELSSCWVIQIHMTLEAWAKALANRNQKCVFELSGSSNIGRKIETKSIAIKHPSPNSLKTSDATFAKTLKPYEVEGWSGEIRDFTNRLNYDRVTKKYWIRFTRWVEAEEAEKAPESHNVKHLYSCAPASTGTKKE